MSEPPAKLAKTAAATDPTTIYGAHRAALCTLCRDAEDWVLDSGNNWNKAVYFGVPSHVPDVLLCSGCKKTPFMLEGCKERGDDVYKEWLEKCIGGGFFIGPQLETEEEMVQRAMGIRDCDNGRKNPAALRALINSIRRDQKIVSEEDMTAALDAIPGVLTAAQADELWGELKGLVHYFGWVLMDHTANQWDYRNTGVTYPDTAFPEAKMRVDVMCYRQRDLEMAYGTRFRTALAEVQRQGGSRYDILRVICTALVTRIATVRGVDRTHEWMTLMIQYFLAAVPGTDGSVFDGLDPIKNSDALIRTMEADRETTTLLAQFMCSHRDIGPDLPRQNPLLRQLLKKLTVYKHWERVQKRVFAFGKMLRALRDTYDEVVERGYAPGGAFAQATLARLGETAHTLDNL